MNTRYWQQISQFKACFVLDRLVVLGSTNLRSRMFLVVISRRGEVEIVRGFETKGAKVEALFKNTVGIPPKEHQIFKMGNEVRNSIKTPSVLFGNGMRNFWR